MTKTYLVGHTGFVGGNIAESHTFSGQFNSRNITAAYGGKPDLLVYAGVPAEMFLANSSPRKDWELIQGTIYNIQQISPKRLVLISTVAVYPETKCVDEDTYIDSAALPAYGANRYALECWIRENLSKFLIVRLPALFGKGLKKNFLYDYIHIVPALLKKEKYAQLVEQEPMLSSYYCERDENFYACRELSDSDAEQLKGVDRKSVV